jgi:hypothetical protein
MPAQLIESMSEVLSLRMPLVKIVVPQNTVESYMTEKRVNRLFYEMYIKDKNAPLELIA